MDQEKIFNTMCDLRAWSELRSRRKYIGSCPDIDTRKYQEPLLNTTTMDCTKFYTIKDAVGDRDLNNLTQQSMKLISRYISSY